MTGANIQERYGTESENNNDKKIINSIWRHTPSAYEGEKIMVLPYAMFQPISCPIGTTAPQQFKINSVYDPDLTGAGNQPLGRDTWAAIYNYYKVLETHVTFSVTELTDDSSGLLGANQYPSLIGWMADLTANPPTNNVQWLMASLANSNNEQQKFSKIVTSDIINGRGSKTHSFTYHWDASQFDTSILDNTKNEWTPMGSDPANINYFSILYFNPGAAGSLRPIVMNVEIKYLVAFKQVNRTLLNTVN